VASDTDSAHRSGTDTPPGLDEQPG
jgi:hypothetical protein